MLTPRTDVAADVRVNSALTGRESAELDVWLAARFGEVPTSHDH
jgi:hypothetical protein